MESMHAPLDNFHCTNGYLELQDEFPDVAQEGLKSFLKYVYTDEAHIALDQAIDVLTMAKFYHIPALVEKCVSLLKCSICEKNVVEIYQAGTKLEEKELYDGALAYIFRNTEQVITSPAFFTLSEENLCFLLERDELKTDELSLFNAVYRWGQEKCKRENLNESPDNLRVLLQKAVKRIRFPLLKSDQLTIHVAPKRVLTDAELLELYKYLSLSPSQRASALPVISFPSKRRELRSKTTVYSINRYERTENGAWNCENKFWKIDFRVNRSISIHGYGFVGPQDINAVYDVEIQLVGPKVSVIRKEVVQVPRAREQFRSEFIQPIQISGGVWYTAVFKLIGPPTVKAAGQIDHVSLHCGDIGRVNFAFRAAAENSAAHQLSQILFSL